MYQASAYYIVYTHEPLGKVGHIVLLGELEQDIEEAEVDIRRLSVAGEEGGAAALECRLEEGWWKAGGRLVEGWWKVGGRLVEGWWKVGGRLVEGSWKVRASGGRAAPRRARRGGASRSARRTAR